MPGTWVPTTSRRRIRRRRQPEGKRCGTRRAQQPAQTRCGSSKASGQLRQHH